MNKFLHRNKFRKAIVCLFGILSAAGLRAQLFSPLGGGMNREGVHITTDKKGNILAFTYERENSSGRQLIYSYNYQLQSWTSFENPVPVFVNPGVKKASVLINDTLYLACDGKWDLSGTLYRITAAGGKEMLKVCGDIDHLTEVDGKLLISGRFGCLTYKGNNYNYTNQVYLENDSLKPSVCSDAAVFSDNRSILSSGDTVVFLKKNGRDFFLKRFTENGYTDSLLIDTGDLLDHIYMTRLNDQIIIHGHGEKLIIVNGKSLKTVSTGLAFNDRARIAGIGSRVIVKPGNGFLYKWDLSNNKFTPFYQTGYGDFWDSFTVDLFRVDSLLVLNHPRRIVHKNSDAGHMAVIDFDSIGQLFFDTVVVMPFFDKDKNLLMNGSDELIDRSLAAIWNYTVYSGKAAGMNQYEEMIPDYIEADYGTSYEIIRLRGICLKLPFSGTLKTRNMRPGVTRDTLWFPFQQFLEPGYQYNLILENSTPTRRHRMFTQSLVQFTVFNNICDGMAKKAVFNVKLPPNCSFSNVSPSVYRKNGNVLSFDFEPDMSSLENDFFFSVSYDTRFFKVGDTVVYQAWITSSTSEDPSDNYAQAKMVLVYSYDPNQKYSSPEGNADPGIRKIQYHIDFENEGNDYAERVIIKDTLDARLPIYEFRMVKASHPYTVSLQGNVVTWVFDNIMLTPKKENSIKSKGYVNFVANLRGSLNPGDSLRNRASIYFDYNAPIITNYAVIQFPRGLKGADAKAGNAPQWVVSPNPVDRFLYIRQLDPTDENIRIYSSQGKLVHNIAVDGGAVEIDLMGWSKGLYILKDSKGMTRKVLLY